MPIVQGGNTPIVLEFDEDVEASDVSISLFSGIGKMIKHWDLDDCEVVGGVVTCPLTQEETQKFPEGITYLEVKLLADDGSIIFYDAQRIEIKARYDKGVTL